MQKSFLRPLGVYGFDEVELLVLAALVSEDPILLIGNSGTGKTFLLNSISEALGLNHRHYNASMISFDDLVGFPYPDEKAGAVRFLPTPATIWDAESVLIDEISRCKPEVQNKFFSIIHERRMQGIPLDHLRFRWAAMNPFRGVDGDEGYAGSEPLDQALADRFAFVIDVPDWAELSQADQESVIDPAGEGRVSTDTIGLREFIASARPLFLRHLEKPDPGVVMYCRLVSTLLTAAGLRISPRRARLLASNIFAVLAVAETAGQEDKEKRQLLKLALQWSIPQRAWKESIPAHAVQAAHSEAIRVLDKTGPGDRWISTFLMTPALPQKIRHLFEDPVSRETKSIGFIQMLNRETPTRAALMAFATFPLLRETGILTAEATNMAAKLAIPIYKLKGTLQWRETSFNPNTKHPAWSDCTNLLNTLPKSEKQRRNRAEQFFLWLLTREIAIPEPGLLEQEIDQCMQAAGRAAGTLLKTKGEPHGKR